MKNILVLSPELSKVTLVIGLIIGSLLVVYGVIKVMNAPIKTKGAKIAHPKKAFLLSNLAFGTTIIILYTDTLMPIAQRIEDYQNGMATGVFENTFWLDGFGSQKLERLKTYRVEGIDCSNTRVLNQVSMFISSDFSFG